MSRVEGITVALTGLRETADALVLTQRIKILTSARQQLMRICLMSDIPYQLIFRKVEEQVQSHRKLHDTEVRSQVSACLAYLLDQECADLFGQPPVVLRIDILDIVRTVYRFK